MSVVWGASFQRYSPEFHGSKREHCRCTDLLASRALWGASPCILHGRTAPTTCAEVNIPLYNARRYTFHPSVGTQWAHLNIQTQRHDWGYNTKQSTATSLRFRFSPLSVVFPKKAHAQSRSMAGESSEEETYDDLGGKQVMYS